MATPSLVSCYCAGATAVTVLQDDLCASWLKSQSVALSIQNGAAIVTTIVNQLLQDALKRLSTYEAHRSMDAVQLSISYRLFIAQFINTAILPLILTANIPWLSQPGAKYSDFTSNWYFTVGASLLLTMIVNVFAQHVSVFSRYVWAISCRCRGVAGAKSQRHINMRFLGPEMRLAARYSAILTTVAGECDYRASSWHCGPANRSSTSHPPRPISPPLAVCLMFSTGMPLLLPIACFAFILA